MPTRRNGSRLPHDRQEAIYRPGRPLPSHKTIRRDLSDMQSRQLLRRVHGGAVPLERMNHEPLLEAPDMVNAEENLRIATMAVEEVPERGSVIIDSGTTGEHLAHVLPVERDVHVVTNSLITRPDAQPSRPTGAPRPRRAGANQTPRDGRRHHTLGLAAAMQIVWPP